MTLDGEAWIIPDGNLCNGETFHLKERGQEPMHALEEFQVSHTFALKGAIGAAGIADLFAGEFVPHPIGNTRGCDADKIVALATRLHPRAKIRELPRADLCCPLLEGGLLPPDAHHG